ncbi:vacuolar protein sorting-associated protein 1 [Nematocida minor]|uniref:vacuolar protein sorting-associated protein 1 n=1 Tax=Nematocida minor TaxID=1912983 RepID=UPI00222003AE|nr:vacuolar protein sorting-associated protein 1 [Nematocida minor]KAI5190684.1 vacuolar protein sorting-associated protein 1 [Nematocida minor]
MEDVIEKVNKLQELCIEIPNPINIPQIVVVGAQSSGKSSILENIVGAEILPRGTGMVTRRPLMIQIVSTEGATHCTFGHSPGRAFKLHEVQEEITKETERILDKKNDISAIPIVLKIHKPNALPITLIDLPGVIKIRSEGQPEGIVKKVEEIVRSYIQNNNTIILAVTPATTDIASSDALMLAKEVDPELTRTLCVLTKVDLMDPGSDLVNVLQGKIVKNRLGFVPVICRGELSVKEKVRIEDALKKEEEYFRSHPSYIKNHLYCGVPYLIVRLHDILRKSIVKSTPYLQDRISFLLNKIEKEVAELGGKIIDERQMIMQIISEFKQEIDQKITGAQKHTVQKKYISKEIINGARISYTLDTLFPKSLEGVDLFNSSDAEINNVMHNTSGVFGGANVSNILSHFVSQAVDKIHPHCTQLSTKIFLEMQNMMEVSLDANKIGRFPKLKTEICRSVSSLLKERLTATTHAIKEFLQWNTVYIRPAASKSTGAAEQSATPDAISAQSVSNTGNDSSISLTDNSAYSTEGEMEIVKESVRRQVSHLKSTVVEQVPKIIVLEMVYKTMQELQNRLINDLYKPESISELLQEEQATKDKREILEKSFIALEKARIIANTL